MLDNEFLTVMLITANICFAGFLNNIKVECEHGQGYFIAQDKKSLVQRYLALLCQAAYARSPVFER